jgi:hypothetical protein
MRSPLTESNRRPSPYHREFPRFTAWLRVPPRHRQHRPGSCHGLRLPGTKRRLRDTVLTSPGQAKWRGHRVRHAVRARPVGLSADRSGPSRRSDDGQTISCCQYGRTRNGLLSRHFRYCQENLNLRPSPRFPVTYAGDDRGVLPGRRPSRGECHGLSAAIRTEVILQAASPRSDAPHKKIRMPSVPSIIGRSMLGQSERFYRTPIPAHRNGR